MDWLFYEKECIQNGYKIICGVDEAGRGPLAGPVFASAVIFSENTIIENINDSKKLCEKKRENLYENIIKKADSYSIACATENEIDTLNILNATFLAMKRAIEGLNIVPNLALIDGNKAPPNVNVPCKTIVKGDSLSQSIAAASILAKVSRDKFMKDLSKKYPEYHFEKHKGYGTELHRNLLKELGPCPIHRMTFLKNILGDF